jgi:hypothetical protein
MDPPPLNGSMEVVQATHAFNAMQERLRRCVENRTQILAAPAPSLRRRLCVGAYPEGVQGVSDRYK